MVFVDMDSLQFYESLAKLGVRSNRRYITFSKHSQGFAWHKISKELEESAQLRLSKPEDVFHLPVESNWWYFWFGLSYALQIPRLFAYDGIRMWESRHHQHVDGFRFLRGVGLSVVFLPACVFIFAVQLLIVTAVDTLKLLWKISLSLRRRESDSQHPGSESTELPRTMTEDDFTHQGTRPKKGSNPDDHSDDERPLSDIAVTNTYFSNTIQILYNWLQSPPRPIKDYSKRRFHPPAATESVEVEPQLRDLDPKHNTMTNSDELLNDEEEWEKAIEQNAMLVQEKADRSDGQLENAQQLRDATHAATDESHQGEPSWWMKWSFNARKHENAESKV